MSSHELAEKRTKEGNSDLLGSLGSFALMTVHQGSKCLCFVMEKINSL